MLSDTFEFDDPRMRRAAERLTVDQKKVVVDLYRERSAA
jgi:hypothetical protein